MRGRERKKHSGEAKRGSERSREGEIKLGEAESVRRREGIGRKRENG